MSHDNDFGVLVPASIPSSTGLTLAEIETRLKAQRYSQAEIDYTLWLIARCRDDLRQRQAEVFAWRDRH